MEPENNQNPKLFPDFKDIIGEIQGDISRLSKEISECVSEQLQSEAAAVINNLAKANEQLSVAIRHIEKSSKEEPEPLPEDEIVRKLERSYRLHTRFADILIHCLKDDGTIVDVTFEDLIPPHAMSSQAAIQSSCYALQKMGLIDRSPENKNIMRPSRLAISLLQRGKYDSWLNFEWNGKVDNAND